MKKIGCVFLKMGIKKEAPSLFCFGSHQALPTAQCSDGALIQMCIRDSVRPSVEDFLGFLRRLTIEAPAVLLKGEMCIRDRRRQAR